MRAVHLGMDLAILREAGRIDEVARRLGMAGLDRSPRACQQLRIPFVRAARAREIVRSP